MNGERSRHLAREGAVALALWLAVATAPLPAAAGTQGPEFQINVFTTGDQRAPDVAGAGNGSFIVVWEDAGVGDGSGEGIVGRRYGSAGQPLGDEFLVNRYTTGAQRTPAVSAASGGGFVVVWTDDGERDGSAGGIFGQRHDGTGKPVGVEFQVNSYTTGDQYDPAVDMAGSGAFVVVWRDAGGRDGSKDAIFGQRYDAAGRAVGGEFQVNVYETRGFQRDPDVAMAPDGGFVVVWVDELGEYGTGSGEGIFAQRFSAAGALEGTSFQVNTFTPFSQGAPAVSADGTGDFVVVWRGSGDGSGDGIFGQRFSSTGAAQGGEFQVNSYTTGSQGEPAVSCALNGTFVVVWEDGGRLVSGRDGSREGLFGQRYTRRGERSDDEFQVNAHTTNGQFAAAVGANGAGDFLAVWASDGQDSIPGAGIYGRGIEAVVTTSSTTSTSTTSLPPGVTTTTLPPGGPCTGDEDCDDGNACTDDLCGPNGCRHPPNTVSCDDGNVCTLVDNCTERECVGSFEVAADVACSRHALVVQPCVEKLPGSLRKLVKKKMKAARKHLKKADKAARDGEGSRLEKARKKATNQLLTISKKAGRSKRLSAECKAKIARLAAESAQRIAGFEF
jgi:hypothetical protein